MRLSKCFIFVCPQKATAVGVPIYQMRGTYAFEINVFVQTTHMV
jgi:hypothetical protein